MKLLLSISLIFSFVVSADDHETPEYKYEPDVNKAEYYIGNYNEGKDINDLINWYEKFAKWAEDKGDTCLLYTSPSPRDEKVSRMPSSA